MAAARLGDPNGSIHTRLPPAPRLPGLVQTVWYTFDQPGLFAACRSRFGSTWRVRLPGFPPVVVTSDADAIRALFTGDPLARRNGNDLLRPLLGERSLLLLEPQEHLARRRLELPPFHGREVRKYAQHIRDLVQAELSSWPPETAVAAHPRARELTLSVILELVLGVHDPRLRAELGRIFDSFNTHANNLGMFLPRAFARRAWWNLATDSFYSRMDRLHELLRQHIVRTRDDPRLDERSDVLALLVRASEDERAGLSDLDLRDELKTLVIAGHETTATAIAWACDLLAHHPEVAGRLRETLDAGDREYLKAAAKEVLRARTIAYVSAGRHLLEPFSIGDWELGPEVLVLVDAQGVHGDPERYPQPEAFRPERFLEGPPDGYAYIPFGGGAHRCLGAPLAMLELELFLEELVTRFELSPSGPPARPVRRSVTLAPSNRGLVRVRLASARSTRIPERRAV